MTDHRVVELSLSIRVAEGRESLVTPRAERFARAVLDRCVHRLEDRAPGRVVRIRRLPLRWRLGESSLVDTAAVEHCASEIVESLERVLRAAGAPDPEDEIAVFDDEAHWRASHLRDSMRGRASGVWFYADLEAEGDPIESALATDRRPMVHALVMRLLAEGTLIEVLSALRRGQAIALAQSVGIPAEEDGVAVAEGAARRMPETALAGEIADELTETARALPPGLSPAAVRLALWAEARHRLGPQAEDEVVVEVVRVALLGLCGHSDRGEPDARPATTALRPVDDGFLSEESRPDGPNEGEGRREQEVHETRYGGLFYLLTCVLELDLGEALWKACLPEGDVLSHAASLLLGADAADDPAPWLFGGVHRGRPLPAVTLEQHEEVAVALVAALAAALPRRGLTTLPEVVLQLVPEGTARFLVASAKCSPIALFTWPAPTLSAVQAGLRAFLNAWPVSAPPLWARPGLAELDVSDRLRKSTGMGPTAIISTDRASSTSAVALFAQVAGAVSSLFLGRVDGLSEADAASLLRHYLAVPALVTRTPTEMTVTLPADVVDISVRRAGLDRDPGWVAWLRRTVRLVFEAPGLGASL